MHQREDLVYSGGDIQCHKYCNDEALPENLAASCSCFQLLLPDRIPISMYQVDNHKMWNTKCYLDVNSNDYDL